MKKQSKTLTRSEQKQLYDNYRGQSTTLLAIQFGVDVSVINRTLSKLGFCPANARYNIRYQHNPIFTPLGKVTRKNDE